MPGLDLTTAIDLGQGAILVGIFYRLGTVTAHIDGLKNRLAKLERIME